MDIEKYSYSLSKEQWKILDSLSQLEDTLPYDVESTLVYIAGFVTREDESNANDELDYIK